MLAKEYWDLKKKHEQEISDFPIAFAFDDKQLQEALEKLGADISEVCSVLQCGDIVKISDRKALIDMLRRQDQEITELILSDVNVAYETFLTEMDNHEYCINWDADNDVLSCFNLTYDDLINLDLIDAYNKARREHMRKAHEEWDLI